MGGGSEKDGRQVQMEVDNEQVVKFVKRGVGKLVKRAVG